MFSHPKILFLVSLLFVALLNSKFNPYLLFKFLNFYHSSIYTHPLKFSNPQSLQEVDTFTQLQTRTDSYKFSFFPSTIKLWNSLPPL